jgi:hypothetical protein
MIEEDVAGVHVATATTTRAVPAGLFVIAGVVAAIGGGTTSERHPGHVNLARVVVAVTRIKLVEHALTSSHVIASRIITPPAVSIKGR